MEERVRLEIERGIDHFGHRLAELEENRYIQRGKPRVMDTTDLYKQAMKESVDQILAIKGIRIESNDQKKPHTETAI